MIRCECETRGHTTLEKWSEYTPLIEMIHNTTPRGNEKYTPHELMFGQSFDYGNVPKPGESNEISGNLPQSERMKKLTTNLRRTQESFSDETFKVRRKKIHDRLSKELSREIKQNIEIGDLVWFYPSDRERSSRGENSKFDGRGKGPYKVTSKVGPTVFKVELSDGSDIRECHISQLRLVIRRKIQSEQEGTENI